MLPLTMARIHDTAVNRGSIHVYAKLDAKGFVNPKPTYTADDALAGFYG